MSTSMNVTVLSDRQLLAYLVGEHAAGRHYQGTLKPLFSNGDNFVHRKCAAAKELVRRYLSEEMQARCVLSAPGAVRDFLRLHFAGQEHETFVALFLDAQNRLIAAEELFRGTLTQTSVYPREVVKAALRYNAGAVIFSHNHPSGVTEPSRADELLTQNLKEALALVDVKTLDHFIIAGAAAFSFAERALL